MLSLWPTLHLTPPSLDEQIVGGYQKGMKVCAIA
jgi:hypothetical protein